MNKEHSDFFGKISYKKPLIILDIANNHMGDIEFGLDIIRKFHSVLKKYNYYFAFKFQFRDIDTFIHPDYKKRFDLKYVKRFSQTRLSEREYKKLKDEVSKLGYISMCTPFDENSVDLIEKLRFDCIKIGSCSFSDWPLLERIAKTNKPIIASTAGTDLLTIDRVVTFFSNRNKNIAIHHCVGEYPTEESHLQLNQIDLLKRYFPNLVIGFSTHEEPDNTTPVQIAIAKGARMFERHISLISTKYEINKYSSTPEQINSWLEAIKRAICICGVVNKKAQHSDKELSDLRQFQRGVFAKKDIKKGDVIGIHNTFFAFPNEPKQLIANNMSKYSYYIAKHDIANSKQILWTDVAYTDTRKKIYSIAKKVDALIKKSNVVVPEKVLLEISHHYGIKKFNKYGLCMVTVVNRDYCKKLLIMLAGQSHPTQYHKLKEETFHILYGKFTIILDGKKIQAKVGDVITIKPNVKHSFSSKYGGILEEISSTHFPKDSFYIDEKINQNKNRKTTVSFWRNIS